MLIIKNQTETSGTDIKSDDIFIIFIKFHISMVSIIFNVVFEFFRKIYIRINCFYIIIIDIFRKKVWINENQNNTF